jgi:hypothetical protein
LVVETQLVGSRPGKQLQDDGLLLAAVHIPQDLTDLRADSSFTLLSMNRSAPNAQDCRQFLDTLTISLRKSRSARRKGEVTDYRVAGHEFTRVNFEYRSGTRDRAVVCSPARDYLLLWKIEGSYWDSVDDAASTIYAILPWPLVEPRESPNTMVARIYLSQGDSLGLLRKKILPSYPIEARENHVQGSVRMQAVIGKTGDVQSSWQFPRSPPFASGSTNPMSTTANQSRSPRWSSLITRQVRRNIPPLVNRGSVATESLSGENEEWYALRDSSSQPQFLSMFRYNL